MVSQENNSYEESLDLKRYFQIIIRHKWLGLIVMIITSILVSFYAMSLPESYEASFDLYYTSENKNSISSDNELSYKNLDTEYWRKTMQSWKMYELIKEYSGMGISPKNLKNYFQVSSSKEGNLFTVKLTVPEPEYIPILADAYLKAIQTVDKHNQSDHFKNKIDYLQNEISRNSSSLDSLDMKILQLSNELNLQNIESVEQLTSLREGFKQELKETEVELSYVKASKIKTEKELTSLNDTLFEKSSFTEPLKVQLMNLHVDLARALTKYGEQHPVVKGIRGNIVHVEEMLTQGYEQNVVIKDITANPIKRELLGQLIKLKIDEMSLEAKINSLENILENATTINSPNQFLYQLLRNRETTLTTIDFLNKKVIDLNMNREGIASSFYLIDMPTTPMESNSRKTKILLLIGLIAGITAAIGIIILYDLIDDRIKLVDDFKRFFSMPILGAIRHRNGKDLLSGAKNKDDNDVYAEYENELTDLRVNIKQLVNKQEKLFFSVLSPVRKDGKTFILYLIAMEYAKAGRKVLIMDFDIYAPKISRHFNLDKNKGIQNYLLEDAPFNSLINHTDIENIDLISAGDNPYNVKLLFDTPKIDELFNEAKKDYDLIFIDTPALLLSPEVTGLLNRIDINLLVTRIGHTSRKNIDLVLEKLKNLKTGILGSVLTDIKPVPLGSYYDKYSKYRKYYSYDERPALSSEKEKAKKKRIITTILAILISASLIATGIVFRDKLSPTYTQIKDKIFKKSELIDKSNISASLAMNLPSSRLSNSKDSVSDNTEQRTRYESPPIDIPISGSISTAIDSTNKNEVVPATSINQNVRPYYIVAGCFSEKTNADKLVLEMNAKGYSGAENIGKIKGLYTVSIRTIADKEEAISYCEKERTSFKNGLWIYRKPQQ